YGLIPTVSVVNGDNFNLFDGNARINLYAGFKTATYTVTLNFGGGMDSEKVKVPYNTAVKYVVYNTRNAQGEAVLSWSKQEGGTPFTGAIVQDVTLYATEWATTIEFDTDGGERLAPLVARTGAQIALPTPQRQLYSFVKWEQTNGTAAEFAVMPQSNTTLKAVWKPKIVFDTNGGNKINDYVSASGTAITLPTPVREGYVFAGWFTPDKQPYTTNRMPAVGTLLKAGWYRQKTKIKTFLDKSSYSEVIYWKTPEIKYTLDFTEEAPEVNWENTVYVSIDFHADFKHVMAKVRGNEESIIYENSSSTDIYATKEHFYFYSQAQMSDAYYMDRLFVDHGNGQINTNYTAMNFSTSLEVKGGKAYMALAADKYMKNKANETIYIEYYVT
ncbi:MAG: InlB B-repeat-containing protein, partial [Clostridia bacterium]|nr:InlB B-repeat-containing protein [Clostridia bacterium]